MKCSDNQASWLDTDDLNDKAEVYYDDDNLCDSYSCLKQISDRGSTPPHIRFNQGLIFSKKAREDPTLYSIAQKIFSEVLESPLYRLDCLHALGNISLLSEDHELAIPTYRIAIESDPTFKPAYEGLIAGFCSLKVFEEADQAYSEGITNCDGGLEAGLFNMALAATLEKDRVRSKKCFDACLNSLDDLSEALSAHNLDHYFEKPDFEGFFEYVSKDPEGRSLPLFLRTPAWKPRESFGSSD
ncbi:hypothetical protein GOV14_06180 [Candidatus Pacearchaeota archaeon]|nr:hypothetical protein [Candidatus Pacearchaeota archaeon]